MFSAHSCSCCCVASLQIGELSRNSDYTSYDLLESENFCGPFALRSDLRHRFDGSHCGECFQKSSLSRVTYLG
jgi:hypothetical protein